MGETRRFLTNPPEFRDVSRGNPRPHTLKGDALVKARLTPETWRLEIISDGSCRIDTPRTLDKGNALDLATIEKLGRQNGRKFLKAMQCLNIAQPLGQGLWEGVPLRDVIKLVGRLDNIRRVYYWGFHNNDPKQIFQSSLTYPQVMEAPPWELGPFLAYKLNGHAIPLERGGPVRMVVPWAHGFKSIKWLQRIVVTNDYKANDTYAEQNNDPESHLKTAAYLDDLPAKIPASPSLLVSGLVISGLSGLKGVEYSLSRRENATPGTSANGDAEQWLECRLEDAPDDWSKVLPAGVNSRQLLGFDAQTGQPMTWPLRYSMISWSAALKGLALGKYALRARAVDLNGFAQPEPRPNQKTGQNALEVREFEVV